MLSEASRTRAKLEHSEAGSSVRACVILAVWVHERWASMLLLGRLSRLLKSPRMRRPPRASRLCGSETLMGPVFRRVPCYAFMLAFQVLPQSADVPKTGASATQEVASGVVQ